MWRVPLFVLTLAGLLGTSVACEKKAIPPRAEPAAATPAADHLTGGSLVFEERFDAPAFGRAWTVTAKGDWTIVDGWAHSKSAKNMGLWLTGFQLPDGVRVEFDIRSEPRGAGKRFEGDLKCEIFNTAAEHEKGYILVNGGWNNQLDIVARLDEHGKDRKETPARAVEASKVYRWAIVRTAGTLHWYRDGVPFMTFDDGEPVKGRFFGFNNWEAHVYVDNLKVFAL